MESPKILVVEDDEPVASMLCFPLEDEGYGCVQVGTAEDGWSEVLGGSPHAAIVDLRLPGRDGWWLLRRIRTQRRTHRMPVVLITGFLDPAAADRAREFGCGFLGKPFSFAELAATLERATRLAATLPAWSPPEVPSPE